MKSQQNFHIKKRNRSCINKESNTSHHNITYIIYRGHITPRERVCVFVCVCLRERERERERERDGKGFCPNFFFFFER